MKPYAIIAPLSEHIAGGSHLEWAHTINIVQEEVARLSEQPVLIDLFGLRRPPRDARREAYAAQWIAQTPQPPSLRRPVLQVPVDCVVSEPVCGPWTSASCLREERTCTRKVITAPQHGGKPCPPLTWTETRRKYGRAK